LNNNYKNGKIFLELSTKFLNGIPLSYNQQKIIKERRKREELLVVRQNKG